MTTPGPVRAPVTATPEPDLDVLAMLASALENPPADDPPWAPAAPPGPHAGQRVTELREAAGLTTGELAAACGVSEHAIAKLEAGRHRSATFRTSVARALAAIHPHLDASAAEAELLALPPTPVPQHNDPVYTAQARLNAVPPATVNLQRCLRLARQARSSSGPARPT